LDLVSLGFLVVMVLAGGLVALMADKLGRTLGKKRLTLFGMRPRHTATTITVVAGMLIPFITILLSLAVSKTFRDLISQGHQALEQRDGLRAEVKNLGNQKSALASTVAGLKKERDDGAKTVAIQLKQLKAQQAQLVQLTKKSTALLKQTQSLQGNLRLAEYKFKIANSGKVKAESARIVALKDLNEIGKQLAATQKSYYELKRQADEQNNRNIALTTQNDTLSLTNNKLDKDNTKLAGDIAKSKAQLEFARLQYDNAQANLKDVQATLIDAAAQVNLYNQALHTDFDVSRYQPLIVGIGDELARVSVPAHSSGTTAQALYDNLMKQALSVAIAKGAKPHPEAGTGPDAASLVPKFDSQHQPIDYLPGVIASITNQDQDQVLVATDFANTFNGEWLPIAVASKPNPLVYHRDTRVANVTVNGSETEPVIIQRVSDFLANVVRPKAIKDQMLPVAGKETEFGAVSLADIVQISHSIMDAGRPVTLTVFASAETHAADPLMLRFRVR
jgi:uncharacterized protein (DUF3084 family)